MTENMISELIRTMDGMYHLMSLQQTFLDRAAERLQDGNREIELRTEVKEDLYRLLHFAIRDEEARSIKAEIRQENSKQSA